MARCVFLDRLVDVNIFHMVYNSGNTNERTNKRKDEWMDGRIDGLVNHLVDE